VTLTAPDPDPKEAGVVMVIETLLPAALSAEVMLVARK